MADSLRDVVKTIPKGGACCLLLCFYVAQLASAQEIHYYDQGEPNFGEVHLTNLEGAIIDSLRSKNLSDSVWASFFKISVESSTRPILGDYVVTADRVIFKPRFLPDPHVSYEVNFMSKGLEGLFLRSFLLNDLKKKISFKSYELERTKVKAIYPQADLLPGNILRFYLEFTQPMGLENPYRFLSIKGKDGIMLQEPFVEVETGLWNPDRTRLTLLLHPGRIKRGVGPNVTKGEIFDLKQTYYLLIRGSWLDAKGVQLGEDIEKTFTIGDPIRSKISTETWSISTPRSGTMEPVSIRVNRLLDHFLAKRLITFHNNSGDVLMGSLAFGATDFQLIFTPDTVWQNTEYYILVNTQLEDVSGNTLVSAFDYEKREVSLEEKKSKKICFRPK